MSDTRSADPLPVRVSDTRSAGPPPALLGSLLLLAGGWALTLWVAPWSDDRVNDLFVYRTFADALLSGGVPYRDVPFEYPPLAAPAIALPGLFGTGEEVFRWAYAGWTFLGAAAVVVLCGALARATGGDPRRAMLAAALMPVLCGALLRTHFDLFPVALLLAGLLLVCRDHPTAGLAVLGLGAMTKGFPLIAVPIALVWVASRHTHAPSAARDAPDSPPANSGRVTRRAGLASARLPGLASARRPGLASARRAGLASARSAGLACAAVMAAVAGAAVAASPDGALDAVRYHLDRPAQIESSPALGLLGLDAAGLGEATSVSSHRSDGLLHPASDWITSLALIALVALVTLLCASMRPTLGGGAFEGGAAGGAPMGGGASFARQGSNRGATSVERGGRWGGRWGERCGGRRGERCGGRRGKRWGEGWGERWLVLASFAAVVGFAVFGKVLSPQFVIWVVPLGALAVAWRLHALAAAVAAAAVLTQVEFPAHYFDVVAREPLALALVAARNLVLLTVVVLAVRELQPRRQQELLDRRRPALAVRLD